MITTLRPVASLLVGSAILLAGTGLFATLLALRGAAEGFSDLALGLIASAYFAGFLAGTLGGPSLIRRIGHIRAYALFASIASTTPIWHALVVDPWAWVLIRLVCGVCLVGLYTVVESWLNAQAGNEHRGGVFSAYMMVNFLAVAAGQFLLLSRPPEAFDLFGVVATLFSLSLVPVMLTSLTQPDIPDTATLSLARLLRAAPAGVYGGVVSGLVMGAFWGLAPLFAKRIGLDTAGVAAFMTAAILGGAALQWPIGRASDRGDRARVMATVAAGGALTALAAFAVAGATHTLLIVGMFVFGGFAFSVYSISVAHLNDRLPPSEQVHAASGLLLLHGAGAVAGPLLAGALMHGLGPGGLWVWFAAVLTGLAVLARRPAASPDADTAHGHFVTMMRTTPVALDLLPDASGVSADRSEPGPPNAPPPSAGSPRPGV